MQRPQLNETVAGARCGCACNVGDGGEQRADDRNGVVGRSQEKIGVSLPVLGVQQELIQSDGVRKSVPFILEYDSILGSPSETQTPFRVRTRSAVYHLGPEGFMVQDEAGQDGGQVLDPIPIVDVLEREGTPSSMENERGTSGEVSLSSSGMLTRRSDSPDQLTASVGSWIDDSPIPEDVGFADERIPASFRHAALLMGNSLEGD